MRSYIKTNEKVEIKLYPYGFTLRTTLFDTMEFNPKKGYRHVTQTINPKNGRLNNPKKSTYYQLLVRYYNEEGHIKSMNFDFNYSAKNLNATCKFIGENFDLFTPEEINYFYGCALTAAIINIKSTVIYCGVSFDDLKPLHDEFIKIAKLGLNNGLNLFNQLILDTEAIDALKDPNYNPFQVKQVN